MRTIKRAFWFVRPALIPSICAGVTFYLVRQHMKFPVILCIVMSGVAWFGITLLQDVVILMWPQLTAGFRSRWRDSAYYYPAPVPIQDEDED